MSYIGNTQQNQNYVPAIDYFNGDGSTVAFTLSRPVASVAAVQAVISNVPQNPGSAFTVSGSTITFTSAPPSGTANIYVYYTSPNTQVVQPGQGTVGTTQLADASVTAAKIASGAAISNIGAGGVAQSNLATGVAGTGPAFSTYCTVSQSIPNSTFTKIQYNTEEFDTANCFDTSNYKFTPNVAGYYQVNARIQMANGPSSSGEVFLALYKNGSEYHRFPNAPILTSYPASPGGSLLVYLNGSTDYIEIYMYQASGSSYSLNSGSVPLSAFQGFLARAA